MGALGGKTHLMQAIGNEILSDANHAKIIAYDRVFTNDFITALRKIQSRIPPYVPEDWCALDW